MSVANGKMFRKLGRVDAIVSRFTKDILGLANKEKVDFDYAGNKGGSKAEIKRTLKIDVKAVDDLLGKGR